MPDVIAFPGREGSAPAESGAGHATPDPGFEHDVGYVLDVLRERLPGDALARVAGIELQSIARLAVLAVDQARHGRALDPRYDERRAAGVAGALAEMIRGPANADEPEDPEPPGAA